MARLRTFATGLKKIQKHFDGEVQKLADKVREEVSAICIKHRLDYLAGNGTMTFYGTWSGDSEAPGQRRVSIGSSFDARDDYDGAFSYLVPIFKVLELEISRDNYLGYYVADVRTRS